MYYYLTHLAAPRHPCVLRSHALAPQAHAEALALQTLPRGALPGEHTQAQGLGVLQNLKYLKEHSKGIF